MLIVYIAIAVAVIILLILGAYLTDPFSRFTLVRRSYIAEMNEGVLSAIDNNDKLIVRQALPFRWFAIAKNGIHILKSRFHQRPASSGETVEEIFNDIYRLRFNPDKLLLTSGDHFSSLFVRNLGVFYYPTLDTHIATTETLWHDRQIVYLQTLAYALGVFDKQKTLTTTIVPTGRHRATCVNFHAYPSDTLYGMLYALAALLGIEKARPFAYAKQHYPLDTIEASRILKRRYQASLKDHYKTYRDTVYDKKTGLVSQSVLMSGAKDITMRRSSFYDNVIFWKTSELAMKLGLLPKNERFLRDLKKRILETFWLAERGYFLEDLSDESIENHYYSSDWLIVLATGFISPSRADEQPYFERSVDYIQKHRIDEPFPIKYQHETRAHRQFPIVRLAVASYGGDAIWSFWGMEYLKVLLALYKATGNRQYLERADAHIAHYEANMLRDQGFPEVYDKHGALLETPLYRSIRQTGWVIGFDQVRTMRAALAPNDA